MYRSHKLLNLPIAEVLMHSDFQSVVEVSYTTRLCFVLEPGRLVRRAFRPLVQIRLATTQVISLSAHTWSSEMCKQCNMNPLEMMRCEVLVPAPCEGLQQQRF